LMFSFFVDQACGVAYNFCQCGRTLNWVPHFELDTTDYARPKNDAGL
jgi:hypothetical protein